MKLRLGGVPEHFNYMWHLPAARELLRRYGLVYEFEDYPGGTGAMTQALEQQEIDMAIMLTEGAIAAVANDKDFKILFPFVMSPLIWGVFSSAYRKTSLPEHYNHAQFAISRFFSGSHLMAQFLAQREGKQLRDDNFVISYDLSGARQKLAAGEADYFLWEKYMTRPLVHKGEFVQVDEVSAPWPAFVFVVKNDFNMVETEMWKQAVYELTSDFLLENINTIIQEVGEHYELKHADVADWFANVRYYDNNDYWKDRLIAATIIMYSKNMIQRQPGLHELLGFKV